MEHLHLVDHAAQHSAWLARLLVAASLALLLASAVAVAWVVDSGDYANEKLVWWLVATLFMFVAVPISVYDVVQHLLHFEYPELQKFVVRILFMVPIYSVTCWVCLGNEDFYVFLEAMRSLYEAFVIWNFIYFLMGYLGPTEEMVVSFLEGKAPEEHIWPASWVLTRWEMGYQFLFYCKMGALQYVVWKIANVGVVLLSSLMGIYADGEWRPDRVYFWSNNVTNLSQMVALYVLVLFYHATHKDLAPIQPLAKFLCIKLIVFFSFWQSSLVSALVYFHILQTRPGVDPTVYAKSVADLIICTEMIGFAVAHHYFFSYKDFVTHHEPLGSGAFTPTLGRRSSLSGSGSGLGLGLPGLAIAATSSYDGAGAGAGQRQGIRALLEAASPRDLIHDISHSIRRVRRGSRGSTSGVYDQDDSMGSPMLSAAAQGADPALARAAAAADDDMFNETEQRRLHSEADAYISLSRSESDALKTRDVL
jgi:hypothetical protein